MSTSARRGWLWFVLGDVSSKASTFVVLSQVSHHFAGGQAEAFVLAQTVSSLLIAAGDLGFRALGTRHIARTHDENEIAHIGQVIQRRRLVAAVSVGLPVALAAVLSLADRWDTRGLLAFLSLCWLPYFWGYDWALLARGDFRRLTESRLAQVAVILLATAAARLFHQGLWCVGLGYAAGYALSSWVAARGMPRLKASQSPSSHGDDVAQQLSWRASFTLAVSFSLNALFHSEEVLMTGWFQGAASAASFGASFRLILTICSIGWIATQYLSPKIARRDGATRARQLSYAAPLSLWGAAAVIGTLVLGAFVCQLVYGSAFPDAAITLRQLAPVILLDSISAFLGTVLVMQGHDRASVVALAVGLLGSALTFLTLHVFGGVDGTVVPVAAKYAGYLCLLAAQLRFALATTPRREAVVP